MHNSCQKSAGSTKTDPADAFPGDFQQAVARRVDGTRAGRGRGRGRGAAVGWGVGVVWAWLWVCRAMGVAVGVAWTLHGRGCGRGHGCGRGRGRGLDGAASPGSELCLGPFGVFQ